MRVTRKIDVEWHEANRMPKNPTLEERMQWHFQHNKHCQCYPMSAKLRGELETWMANRDAERGAGASDGH